MTISAARLFLMALVTMLLVGACVARAQDVRYLHHQAWSTEEGLPQNSVHQIVQDREGFLWVATEGGLARFDGVSFKVFGSTSDPALPSEDVCCVVKGQDGDLLVGTSDGVFRRRGQRFEKFGAEQGLPSPVVRSLVARADGSVVVLTAAGVAEWKNGRFEAVSGVPATVQSIAPAADGGVLVLAAGRILELRGGGVAAMPMLDGRGTGALRGVAAGPGGGVWRFSDTAVLFDREGEHRQWTVGAGVPGSRVEMLFVDRAGRAWIGTNDGLAVLAHDEASAMPLEAMRGSGVLGMFEDREGDFWIGSDISGLHELRPLKFRSEPALADEAVTAVVGGSVVAGSKEEVWIGTRKDGLRRFRNGRVDQPARADELTSPTILSLAAGKGGAVWAGTPDGLNEIDEAGKIRRITSSDGLPDDYVQALLVAGDGSLWIGTRQGLVHLRDGKMKTFTTADGLGGDLIGSLFEARDGAVWVGTSGGLSRVGADGKIAALGLAGDASGGAVGATAEDRDGTLWVASRSGAVSRLTGAGLRQVTSARAGEEISGMVADGKGFLWLRRRRGIERVSEAELNRCAAEGRLCDEAGSQYGSSDGMPSEETYTTGSPTMWRMADGEVWAATRRGVAIVDAEHLPFDSVPPQVAIEQFVVGDAAVRFEGQEPELAYGPGRFLMEYAGLTYTVPSEVRYRFVLEGFDPAWTEAGGRRSATYTNLPPGSYVFRVQATNSDGVKSATDAVLRFRIVPPFYRRWWFLTLVAMCFAGVAVVVYRLRLRRLQRRFDAVLTERNRLAREVHDTLAQDFVGVSIQLDIVTQMLGVGKTDAALKQVQATRKLVTDGLADARQSIWELRANLDADSLPTRLNALVERYAQAPLKVQVKIGGAYRRLDSRIEGEVLRVAQEALSNVQRHAGTAMVLVELHYGSNVLVLTVTDDGRGFVVEEAAATEGHYGLRGMRERSGVIGARLEIASSPGAGTRVMLAVPVDGTESKAR